MSSPDAQKQIDEIRRLLVTSRAGKQAIERLYVWFARRGDRCLSIEKDNRQEYEHEVILFFLQETGKRMIERAIRLERGRVEYATQAVYRRLLALISKRYCLGPYRYQLAFKRRRVPLSNLIDQVGEQSLREADLRLTLDGATPAVREYLLAKWEGQTDDEFRQATGRPRRAMARLRSAALEWAKGVFDVHAT